MKLFDPTLVPQGHVPRVFVLQLRQDDPKKCTAAKMVKFRLAQPLFRIRQIPRRALVLNPFASEVLLNGHRDDANHFGLVAIDCSWEKVEGAFASRLPGRSVRLPTFLAANPVNYAKQHKLSSLEALAASLYIMGFQEKAKQLLSLFKWAPNFLSLNQNPLDAYATAKSEQEITDLEAQFF